MLFSKRISSRIISQTSALFLLTTLSAQPAFGATSTSSNALTNVAKELIAKSTKTETIVETLLPLRLVAIHRGTVPLVIIEATKDGEKTQDVFSVGNSVFDLAKLDAVSEKGVWLTHDGIREFLASRAGGLGGIDLQRSLDDIHSELVSSQAAAATPALTNIQPSTQATAAQTDEQAKDNKNLLLGNFNNGPVPLNIVDRRRLFKNVQDFTQVLQSHKPQLTRTANGSLALAIGTMPADSPAAELGIQAGDTIKGINGNEFKTVVDAYSYVTKMSNNDILTLDIERGGSTQQISFASQYPERLNQGFIDSLKEKQTANLEAASKAKEAAAATPAADQIASSAPTADAVNTAFSALATAK